MGDRIHAKLDHVERAVKDQGDKLTTLNTRFLEFEAAVKEQLKASSSSSKKVNVPAVVQVCCFKSPLIFQ